MCTRCSLRLVAPPRCGPVGAPVERFRRVGVGGAGKAGQGNHDKMTTQTTLQDPVTCSAFWVCSSGRGVGVRSSEQVPHCVVFTPLFDPYPCRLSLSLRLLHISLPPASGLLIPASFLPACRAEDRYVQPDTWCSHLIAVYVICSCTQKACCRPP